MNSSNKEKRPRESSESNKSFVKNVTSRMSGLLPSTITKWFSSPSSSNANGSATAVDASDSSTEDEAPESPTLGQPPSKRLRLSPSANHFIGINTKSSSTNTDSIDYMQNTILSSPSMFLKRDPNFISTPFVKKSEESTAKTSESENISYILKNSLSSGDTSVTKTRKSLFNSFGNDKHVKKEDKSNSDLNRQSYNKSSLLGSPFYPGRTTYGGAASTSYLKNSNIHKNKNTVVNETQTNESLNVSHSARRIMDLLENYSSPLTEVKRLSQYVKSENMANTTVNTSSSNPDCKKVISYKTQELHVPSIASILSIKRRSRLMATTSAARQLIASHSSSATTSPYPAASNSNTQEKNNSSKLVTKMKSTLLKNKHEKFETVMPLDLPTAVLQIDKDNLPKFSFQSTVPKETTTNISVPLPSSSTNLVTSTPQFVNVKSFALVSTEQCKSMPNSSYSFSEPVTVSNDSVTSHKLPVYTFLSPERSVDGSNRDFIKNDSVSSIVGKTHEKVIASTNVNDWKCNDCWVTNKAQVDKCVCCGGKKPETNGNKMCPICKEVTLTESLDMCSKCKKVKDDKQELKVKSDSEKWKCQDCWVSNDSDKEKCVCCGGKKPVNSAEVPKVESTKLATKPNDSMWKCEDCWVTNDLKNEKCVCCGGKKPTTKPEGEKPESIAKGWKCNVCLLENVNNAVKCVACLTAKPSSNLASKPVNSNATINFNTGSNNLLQDIVKSQSQKWECPFCLVHNDNSKSQCVCCDSERPGAAPKQPETKFNFGLSPSTIFKFGIDPKVASDKGKIEEKKPEVKETNNNVLPKTSFTFGIPATKSDTATSKEADKPKDAPAPSPTPAFSFGIPKDVQNKTMINNNDLTTTKSPIPTSTSEFEKIEKPQEVPNVDSMSAEPKKPNLQFSSALFSSPSSQPTLSLPATTASITISFNNTSSVSPIQSVNNEAKSINVPATSSMSITNFFKTPASTAIDGASIKPAENATLNSNITLFQKSEPSKTGINFTAPPLFQKNEEQQPATSTPLFPKIEPQASLNTALISPFQKSDMPTATTTTLFQKPESIVTTSVSLFSTGISQISSTPSLFPKSDITTTSQSVSAPAPIFSFGTNSQTGPTQPQSMEKGKFNFSFGNSNKIGANMFNSTNTCTPAFGIGDNNTNKFGASVPNAGTTNVFSNNASGNGLSSGNILGGNGLGASLGSNNLPSINTGNPLQNNMQLPIAQGTGIFGATPKENSTWPTSNNAMPNIFSTSASTNAVQKPAAFSFGSNNLSFNVNNNSNIPVFGSNTQPSQNVFSLSNSTTNNVASPFSNPVQNQPAPTMFGNPQPASNSAPSIGMFGQQNVAPAFGSTNNSAPQNSVPTPTFNFGSPQPSAVFGFGQQGQQQASGVYSFGSSASPQVQFAVGSAPSGAAGAPANVRRVKKVVRRTTQR